MSEIRIFVESHKGVGADQNLINGIINHFSYSNPANNLRFEGLGGKDIDKFRKSIPLFIKNNEDGKNLIIIDADDYALAARRGEITDLLHTENINAEIFFFPNDADPGELEDLLIKIIPDTNSRYLDCLHEFDVCIDEPHSEPSLKDKLHIYCCSLLEHKEQD
jgi:hypothetical protein